MATTSKPTGLTLSRNGNNFTLSWKKGDNNYDAGQNFEWRTNNDAKFIANSINKRDTSKVKQLSESDYYPNTELLLEWIEMRVRGKRAKYKKKGKTIKPTMSAWATKRLDLAPPKKPQLTATMHESQWNVCTFAWEVETSDTDIYWFNDVEWETILVRESNVTDGANLAWETDGTYERGTGTRTDSEVITEDSFALSDGSYTRWFRVRSRGPRGASGWSYQNHVYALPYQAAIKSAAATVQPAGGFQCKVVWEAPANPSHPIDKTTVEYSITVPDANLSCPDDASWTSANVSADTENKDAVVFPIDRLLANDQCLFVRVNTEHDGVNTYGVPKLVDGGVGALSNPTLNSVTIGDNYMVTINATNASTVADSYLVILYRPASDPTREIVLGTIPHGQTSKSVQAPDWSGETAYAFGVYAAVGDSTTISHDGALMKSEIVWGTGNVPKAPENVTISATNISGTIRVEWDWTWTEADGAELSWADHEDAWESTDEPDTYELSNIRNSRWNISGLETGVKWYVKVRLKKGTGENETYGPYSETKIIDLTSAPSIPTLVLSEPVITEKGSVTASWVYTTTDGTAQTYAEICEAELTTEGIEYGDIIAHTETAQHVTINAEDAGWQTGETYYLCVRVVSASGRVSDDWSAPVPIAIAEPLEVNITETSLVEEIDETNPRTFSGNPISFDTEIAEDFTKLEVALEATQSGSGTPSPSNVRPISGHTEVTVTVADDADDPTVSEDYTTALGRTVFGGTLDLVSGVLTVTWASVDFGSLGWAKNTLNGVITFYAALSDAKLPSSNSVKANIMSSSYEADTANNVYTNTTSGRFSLNTSGYIQVRNSNYSDASTFKTAMTGQTICYELATPQTYQLTPQQINTLLGVNNVWSDDGELNIRIAESARDIYALKEMPLTLTVDKTNITAVIERANSYHIDRPDETSFDGFENETIAIKKGNVESFDIEDLIGSLDDGASYRLIVTVKDELGQSAEDSIDFEVHWTHQALIPEGQVVIDSEEYIAKITPQAPQDALSTDKCDIYRLSSDRPELVVKGGTFAETYVDPYPAIGQFGGYRLVFRTANGDYITEDNEIAWLDIDETLDIGYTIIDFDGGQVFLEYNVDVSNSWAKDFQETKYLGGSVQGDWNPAVSRTSSINAVTITIVDEEQIEMIHRLAVTPSLCHVRTTGGASFSADVQVTENYTHEKRGKIASYTFAITRVDTEDLDGMTLAQWEDLQEEDELE